MGRRRSPRTQSQTTSMKLRDLVRSTNTNQSGDTKPGTQLGESSTDDDDDDARTSGGKPTPAREYCEKCDKWLSVKTLMRHMCKGKINTTFQCESCGQKFSSKPKFLTHIQTHINNKPHKCDTCGKQFVLKSSFDAHICVKNADAGPVRCDICGDVHLTREQFHCSYCKKAFAHETSLAKHLDTHVKYEYTKCQFCVKTFATKAHLDVHVKTHT